MLPDEVAREEAKEGEIQIPTFEQGELQTYTEEQIAKMRSNMLANKDENGYNPTS